MRDYARFLGGIVAGIAVVVCVLAAFAFAGVFVVSLVEHLAHDDPYGYSPAEPILWWPLGAFAAAVVVGSAVGYVAFGRGEGESYYCPNCECRECVAEREARRRDDVMLAAAAGGALGAAMISDGD